MLDGLLFFGLILLLVDLGVGHERLGHLIALFISLVGVVLLHCYFSVLFLLCLQTPYLLVKSLRFLL